ncbi:hypothetical protein T484DRAFT_1816928, partial [Baffinella frigidus]
MEWTLQVAEQKAEHSSAIEKLEKKLLEVEEYAHHMEQEHTDGQALTNQLVEEGKRLEEGLASVQEDLDAERANRARFEELLRETDLQLTRAEEESAKLVAKLHEAEEYQHHLEEELSEAQAQTSALLEASLTTRPLAA